MRLAGCVCYAIFMCVDDIVVNQARALSIASVQLMRNCIAIVIVVLHSMVHCEPNGINAVSGLCFAYPDLVT